jgi:uncharacterized membrane protein YcaP (DUF421 family)
VPGYLGFLAAIAVRTTIVLVLVTAGLRVLGKRKIGELQLYDLMLILIISNAVQNSMTQSNGAVWVAFVASGTILFLGWSVAKLFTHNPPLERRLMGVPTVLVLHGRLVRANLKHEHVDEQEVLMEMRQQGLDRLADVRLAVLETDGTISIVPVESARPQG